MEDIYTEVLIDNYKHPKNWGKPEVYDKSVKAVNEICGDELELFGVMKNNRLHTVHYTGSGCAICLGTMSMLSEMVKDLSVEEIKSMPESKILKMINMPETSARKKCATLPLEGIKELVS